MKIKRLKIYQQLLIVFFVAVLLPLCITTLVITNVNQHAVRAELKYSAVLTTDSVYQRLKKSIHEKKLAILVIAKSLNYIKTDEKIKNFLREISESSDSITTVNLIDGDKNINKTNVNKYFQATEVEIFPEHKKNSILMYVKLNNNRFLKKEIKINTLESELFKYIVNDTKQVYVIDSQNKVIMSYNHDQKMLNKLLPQIPEYFNVDEPLIFGNIKNQPNVYLKIKEPDWSIVVATPKSLTNYGIIDARAKIITAIVVAATFIIILGMLYSYSLNANLAQLFKAVSAIAAGNYRRKARLIKDFFTPYEFVYLVEKFNEMAQKINESYNELQKANEELSKLDKLKSNLIDTVSHEFRTPLTSIRGYTSRLLRTDIALDEETRIKSLKIIKQQAERFSRLVDDLLVIPEIESSLLRVFPEKITINDILKDCILSIQQKQQRQFILQIDENFPTIYADADRLVQIILNLLDNSIKYSPEDSKINLNITAEGNFAVIKIKNECNPISEDKLDWLFEKFTRVEDELTRTTRGTGLGLFIVRGLVKTMGGEIFLKANEGFEVSFTIPLAEN
ncbi:MAG TPA: HAMP domain-containing sensor histidine kinase [Candidatus Gastranaerophilales bacterium]|nr:HAMP domain-containing sensor histidine kinase [Candidatus Gastranaerophilales bacterium]